MSIQKAINFVEENGNELEKYRLDYLLNKERDDEIPLRCLKDLQNDDGGFPYDNEKGKLSSVNITSVNLDLMIELGLTESYVCSKTLDYLMSVQGEDGSWDESHAIKQYNPPFWNTPARAFRKILVSMTAVIAILLVASSGSPDQPRARSSVWKGYQTAFL